MSRTARSKGPGAPEVMQEMWGDDEGKTYNLILIINVSETGAKVFMHNLEVVTRQSPEELCFKDLRTRVE
jgi:hypothetical protein